MTHNTFRMYSLVSLIMALSINSISAQQVTTIAGSGTQGSVNATGVTASFFKPFGICIGTGGNVYVADTYNNKIRKITSAGVVTTFAGSGATGSVNATGVAASFNKPSGLVVDAAGNIFVADYYSNKIRKITSAGVVTTFAGSGAYGAVDGLGTAASFNLPTGLAIDAYDNIFVADQSNHKIRKITSAGAVTTLAGSGTAGAIDATGSAASFNRPSGLIADAYGNVYVADQANNKIRKITNNGVVTTFAGSGVAGSVNSTGTAASFYYPSGIAIDGYGNLYIADYTNHKIRKITSTGVVSTFAGSGVSTAENGFGLAASFSYPTSIVFDPSGKMYVADQENNIIRKITMVATGLENDTETTVLSIY